MIDPLRLAPSNHPEDAFLLRALAAFFAETPSPIGDVSQLDAEYVEEQTLFHGIVGIIERVLRRDAPGASLTHRLTTVAGVEAMRARALWHELGALSAVLAQAGVAVVPLKGVALSARLYGTPELRSCGDIDLLVRAAQLERATTVLESHGFAPRYPIAADHRDLELRGEKSRELVSQAPRFPLTIDLHWSLLPRHVGAAGFSEAAFERASRLQACGQEMLALAPEDEFLYLALHGYWHLWSRLKWLCDLRALLRQLSWTRLAQQSAALGVADLVAVAFRLVHQFFPLPLPSEQVERGERLLARGVLFPTRHASQFLQLRERWRDRLRGAVAFGRPTRDDLTALHLPRPLRGLYWLYRPYRFARARMKT